MREMQTMTVIKRERVTRPVRIGRCKRRFALEAVPTSLEALQLKVRTGAG